MKTKNRIVAAVGRARWHGTRDFIRERLYEPLFEDLRKLSEDRTLPRSVRDWAFLRAYELKPIHGASIGDTFENDLMKLIFNATAIANIADNAASAPLTVLNLSLNTGDPGESGTAATNETTYTSYDRFDSARDTSTSTRFVVTANTANPNANMDFAAGTGGSGTVTHFTVTVNGTPTNASKILFSGTVTPNISVGNGVTPRLTTATAITLD